MKAKNRPKLSVLGGGSPGGRQRKRLENEIENLANEFVLDCCGEGGVSAPRHVCRRREDPPTYVGFVVRVLVAPRGLATNLTRASRSLQLVPL